MAIKKYISLSNLTGFFNNLKNLFATKTELNTKSDKTHTHTISDVSNLQSTLNGKANSSHGTHVTYSTTSPLMDGTASVGSASTVARSDHRHPIDTSRAAQTSLDSHTSNTTSHITSTERTNWSAGYTHSQSSHAPSNAEKNQNAFSYVKVGDTSVAADSATDTIMLVAGTNVTITPDATNDKITISAKDTTYSLSSFGVTATAAELNKLDGVTATATEINYVDGVTSNIQTQLDGKAAKSHTHTVANISDLTATAAELNYMDGVTSNVQTQLDGKAGTSHTHKVLSVQSDNYKQGTDLPSTYPRGETIFFSNNPANKFNNISYCTIHTIKGYNNMVCIQWLYPYNTNADTVYYRTALYNTDIWRDWKTVSVSGHTHNYAASSSAGGSATSAVKLDTSTAGSATQPVYFSSGKPVACTYTLGKSVPNNAVFTDTVYTHPSYTARTGVPTANATLTHGGTFTVTQPVCDATGHITALNTRTYTLPSDNNTDTKVTNTLATTTKAYVTGTTSTSTNTGTQVFDTGVYLDTTAGQLTATTFNGTTYKGGGVATLAEVKTYLGI